VTEENQAQDIPKEKVAEEMIPLTLEQLTYHYGLMKLQLDRAVGTINKLVEYVNNLHQNPAFVGGILGHINDLTEQRQLLFVAVHQNLSEAEQKKCYRCTLNYITKDDKTGAEVAMETWDKGTNEWVTILDDDPIQMTAREAIIGRLVLMDADETVPYYITLMAVDPSEATPN
jgi:hypothetical protein